MRGREVPVHEAGWRKSRRSVGNGACVEVAPASGAVAVRDSTDPVGPMVRYSVQAWQMFIAGTKLGSYDVIR
jgi:hypothetical protein